MDHRTGAPPQNLEAEQCLLGSLLLDGEGIPDVAEILGAGDFYNPSHGDLFGVLLALDDAGRPVDLPIVTAEIRSRGLLGAIPADDLVAFMGSVPNASHALEYARIVRRESQRRGIIDVARQVQRDAETFQGMNTGELVDQAEARLLSLEGVAADDHAETMPPLMAEALERVDAAERGDVPDGLVKTHFQDLDDKIGGLKPGSLTILAARPSMGKSSLATSIIRKVALQGMPAALFTLEVSRDEVADTLLAQESEERLSDLHKPGHTDHQMTRLSEAAQRLHGAPIVVDDSPTLTLMRIRSRARRLAKKHKLGLIVIDYLQLLTHDDPKSESRQGDVSAISAGLKSLARELKIPIVALSQLNRGLESREDKRPMMSDLRESGAIEQDADLILMLYREHQYKPTPQNKHEAELIIRKNRFGPTGAIALHWNGDSVRFDDTRVIFQNITLPPPSPGDIGW